MSFAPPAAADRVKSPAPAPRVHRAASADHRRRVALQAQDYKQTTGPVIPFRTPPPPAAVTARSPLRIALAATSLQRRVYNYRASPHHRWPTRSIYVLKRTVSPLRRDAVVPDLRPQSPYL